MNEGRLFVNGQLRHQDISTSRGFSQGTTVPLPPNTTFISHHNTDRLTAETLAELLSEIGSPCYLDTLDPNVDGDSPHLESYLRDVIGQCNKLMAIVSRTTITSWWVPLEIGVALEKQKYIATFFVSSQELPSYLWQWPVLHSYRDATSWIRDTRTQSVGEIHRSWRRRTSYERRQYVR